MEEIRLLYYPQDEEALRRPCEELTEEQTLTSEFSNNLRTMKEVLLLDGVGLAAPQVNWPVRLFMLAVDNKMQPLSEPHVLINPRLTACSNKTDRQQEGCLSFPDLFLKVTRPMAIRVVYRDLAWHEHTLEATDFYARVLLHELDHINERLFVDYSLVSPVQQVMIKKWLKRQGYALR